MSASDSFRERLQRAASVLIGALVPCAIVALANASYILDHFYARAPLLLDSGWLSSLVPRSGVLLADPGVTQHYGRSFFSVHLSPFMSLFSVLSAVLPFDRIAWYALFQGFVYAPLGLCVYLVSSHAGSQRVWRMPLTALTGLAFAFSAQALVAIEYPHFEPAIAGFLCLLLASIVTNRRSALVWPLLALTVSVREDAGFHAGLALCPLLYLVRRGELEVGDRKRLVRLVLAAFGAGTVSVAVQKIFFPTEAFHLPLFGDPLLHHLANGGIAERVRWLVWGCPHISVPLLATMVLAAVRRDARYMLGWLAATPWLIVNLLMFEEAKWRFVAYVGFPFLVSVFWVFLYGALLTRPERRLGRATLELLFAGIGLASIGATYLQNPALVQSAARGMMRTGDAHPEEVRAFAKAIRERGAALGAITVDSSVAALAIENVARSEVGTMRPETDTIAFHRDGPLGDADVLAELSAKGIARCAQLRKTGYFLCSRFEQRAASSIGAPTDSIPALVAFATPYEGHAVTVDPAGLVIPRGSSPGFWVVNRPLPAGTGGAFEVFWDLVIDEVDLTDPTPLVTVDVVVDGAIAGKAIASRSAPRQRLVVAFAVRAGQFFQPRLAYHGPARVLIEGAQLRRCDVCLPPPERCAEVEGKCALPR